MDGRLCRAVVQCLCPWSGHAAPWGAQWVSRVAEAVRPDMEVGAEEPEPSELFGDLGTLVVEGRMAGGQRGFHEGPHCVLVYPYRQNKHVCDTSNVVCQRESELRRYMYLLWRNNIPMSVEVLLCPPCPHGQRRAAAVDATPEPGYLLLEQWTIHMETAMRCHRSAVGARALLQTVYSYLHFSQLSAWLSRSGGAAPRNVMYRITVPGDAFGTRFAGGAPQLHTFPTAYLARDRTLVQVSVRALPRCDEVPTIPCAPCQSGDEEQALGACAAPPPVPGPAVGAGTSASAGLEGTSDQWSEEDLRRTIIKCRLQGALSDSRDSLLGDSLLDPPRSLHKYPKRYQSPSRSGSPSLETPEHLMFGSRENSVERRADHRSRGMSRRVITDQCAAPDLAWTQGRATWRRHASGRTDGSPPPPPVPTSGDRPRSPAESEEPHRQQRSPPREPDRPGHFYQVRAPPAGRHSPLDDRGCRDARRSPRQSRRTHKDEYRLPAAAATQEGRSAAGQQRERRPSEEERTGPRWEKTTASQPPPSSHEPTAEEWPARRRAPQRSRSDGSNVFRLTPAETQQVVAVLRHAGRPPPPADNPLLSAIERAGQADARTVRVRTSHFVARASPLRPGGVQEAQPLVSPGRPTDGPRRLVHLVRRALSFEQPPLHGATGPVDGGDLCSEVQQDRLPDLPRATAAEDADKRVSSDSRGQVSGGTGERASKELSERVPNGTSERVSNGTNERVCNGTGQRVSNGVSEHVSNGVCERVSNGVSEHVSNDTSERSPNGTSDPESGDSSNRVLKGTGERYTNGCSMTNGSGGRAVDSVGDEVTNGTSALNKKGSRNFKSPNLIKRLFKKDEPEDAAEHQPDETRAPDSASRASFRRSLDSAASSVFSQKTGLPLNSSPAPLRRGNAFHFDASLTKVKTFSSALNELGGETDCTERGDSALSAGRQLSSSCPAGVISSLLGSFEESVLNGRLGPVSTVEGFSADIGASGSFHPKHVRLPVTVFFYSLSDNEKIASPYMGHVHLGRKGYHVPKKGTLQVTLFNPHGTVVKMFVVMYDLSEMPAGSQTFLRQRTLYMPVGESPEHPNSQKWLRYLIHLRFATGRTGRVYVHTDLRMIIFRKSDMDAAAQHTGSGGTHEMRSFVHMPDNPRYSPRK